MITALSRHAAIEEQLLYPAMRQRMQAQQEGVLQALEEHHVVKWVLNELVDLPPEHERFSAKVHVLMENVRSSPAGRPMAASPGATHRIRASADPRFWLPGVQHEVKVTATLPSGLALGTYDVLLHLPDAATSLRDRPEYAIRLANQGLWEATTGFNSLQHILDVR